VAGLDSQPACCRAAFVEPLWTPGLPQYSSTRCLRWEQWSARCYSLVDTALGPHNPPGPTVLAAIRRSDGLYLRADGKVAMAGHLPWKRIRGDVERDPARQHHVEVARRETEVEQVAYRSSLAKRHRVRACTQAPPTQGPNEGHDKGQ
jgi:hypothetical protein